MTSKERGVLLALLESMDRQASWCGETHVQKCAYFLQEGLAVPFGVRFILYKYGPFSFDLRESLGELWGDYLVAVTPLHGYGPSLKLTGTGAKLREQFAHHAAPYQQRIDFVASRLSNRGVAELERIATGLLVNREQLVASVEARARRLRELKPHITEHDAREAVTEASLLVVEASGLDR